MEEKFRKHKLFSAISIILTCTLTITLTPPPTTAWSNGGYSADPSDPDYGTHDWIAQHALDWLPDNEKRYISDNLNDYLYGTELPDNGGAPDGIGDFFNHHVYYYSTGDLQDDISASRAQEEYDEVIDRLTSGEDVLAAKQAGIMSHYIVDVAVFGHIANSQSITPTITTPEPLSIPYEFATPWRIPSSQASSQKRPTTSAPCTSAEPAR